ncbi:MAG: serine hydrolase, partial [Pseudomonadota bacterium]
FPPEPNGQVTLDNWRKPPYARWAFQHVREIVPSAAISNDPDNVWSLPDDRIDFSSLNFASDNGQLSWEDALSVTDTDGIVILHRGRVVHESYAHGMTRATPHIIMSVSKSVLGLVIGVLAEQGRLDPASLVTDIIPEVAETAYQGATIRHLLDMRAGIEFDENYLATTGTIIAYRKATNWNPLEAGEALPDLRSFYKLLTASDGPHEGRFHYVSPNSDLLGWIAERASGRRYADLVSDVLWQPLGAHLPAYVTVDRLGAPRAAGGVCMTAPDLARIGQLLADCGQRDGRQIVPDTWIDDLIAGGDREAWAIGDFMDFYRHAPIRYRGQWYVLDGDAPLLFALGVHGQNLFVDRDNQIVIAKFSSQDLPLDEERNAITMQLVDAIRRFLTA